MAIQWPKTMGIQDGIDAALGQFRMGLNDGEMQQYQRPISLHDIEVRVLQLEEKVLHELHAIAYTLADINERIHTPWYTRLWRWLRDHGRIRRF
jgi:hypothetical protein